MGVRIGFYPFGEVVDGHQNERKGFIRLKECFRVSKTEDHYQQFDS